MGRVLDVLVAIPCRWMVPTDPQKHVMRWMGNSKHLVTPVYESGASRLDMSLSKIILFAKENKPDLVIRLDDDIVPMLDLDTVVSYAQQGFSRGFDVVFGPTRAAGGRIMVKLTEDSKETDLPTPRTCVEAWYGALCFSVMSPKLIEAYRPHVVEYYPETDSGSTGAEMRVRCMRWKDKDPLPELPAGARRIDSTVPALNESDGVPLYVYNPPDTSEDADMCRDLRVNDFRLGCDSRLLHQHWKGQYIASYGLAKKDEEEYAKRHPEWRLSEKVLAGQGNEGRADEARDELERIAREQEANDGTAD